MTLILTTIRAREVLITSDGRSIATAGGKVTGVRDDLRKIFPVPDHPLAISHHGENLIDGKPVEQLIADFISQQNVGNMTVVQIADELRRLAHPPVRKRLTDIREPQIGCGFLIAGFSLRHDGPAVVELFWRYDGTVLHTAERKWEPGSIIASGSGTSRIPKLDGDRADRGSVDELKAYHWELMRTACRTAGNDNVVGGHVHELLITPARWQWTRPPKTP